MNTADPNGPNYLKPPDAEVAWGANMKHCQHDIRPSGNQYICTVCKTPFPQSLIEEKDGVYRVMDFRKYRKGPGRSRRR